MTRSALTRIFALGIVCCAPWRPAAAAEAPLYFRTALALSADAPPVREPRDDVLVRIRSGELATLAEFTSSPSPGAARVGVTLASLFLVTGKNGISGCADLGVELARLSESGGRIPVAAASVATSIPSRQDLSGPIVVPIVVDGLLVDAGERLTARITVRNGCDEARPVTLLYDSTSMPSNLTFTDPPPAVPTPPSCLEQPLTGLALLTCRFDQLEAMLRAEPASLVGGEGIRQALLSRLADGREAVATAQVGRRPKRNLWLAQRKITAIARILRRGERQGRVEATVSARLQGMVGGISAELGTLRTLLR